MRLLQVGTVSYVTHSATHDVLCATSYCCMLFSMTISWMFLGTSYFLLSKLVDPSCYFSLFPSILLMLSCAAIYHIAFGKDCSWHRNQMAHIQKALDMKSQGYEKLTAYVYLVKNVIVHLISLLLFVIVCSYVVNKRIQLAS